MGEIIGGILGGVGSIGGAIIQANAADKAREQALTGYNYITQGPGKTASNAFIDAGLRGTRDANTIRATQMELLGLTPSSGGDVIDMVQGPDGTFVPAGTNNGRGGDMLPQLPAPTGSSSAIRDYWNGALPSSHLVGSGPNKNAFISVGSEPVLRAYAPNGTGGAMVPAGAGAAPLAAGVQPGAGGNAFNNYLKSTGYQFQLQQGQDAIVSNAAARGLLRSGGTAKALTKYGQDLASTTFNNYLAQLGNVGTAGSNAGVTGQNQLGTIVNAGTGAGSTAAGFIQDGGNAWSMGLNGGLGSLAQILANTGRSGEMARAA